jgi:signal transduction histidine kinase
MIVPKLPENESERQKAVNKYKNLHSLSNESYDNITSLVASICNMPISLISIIDEDKNYFKSTFGLETEENLRSLSFCGHAINDSEEITIVSDSRIDERFCNNPFVLNGSAIFYAGVPLTTRDGYKIGTLCVFDDKPRQLDDNQKKALKILAEQVMILFEKEYQNTILNVLQEQLKTTNENLEKFAGVVSHDLKSPLANIISLTNLIEEENEGFLNDYSKMYLSYLKSASYSLRNYIDGILNFYKSDSLLVCNKQEFKLDDLLTEVKNILPISSNVSIESNFENVVITTNKAALQQVFLNLISNALRYNSKENSLVKIIFSQDDKHLKFTVSDNGNGIESKNFKKIFDLFEVVDDINFDKEKGSGIGLATVKKVVESLGGTISVNSIVGQGSDFSFSLAK